MSKEETIDVLMAGYLSKDAALRRLRRGPGDAVPT